MMKQFLILGIAILFYACGENTSSTSGNSSTSGITSNESFHDFNIDEYNGTEVATKEGEIVNFVEQGELRNGKRHGFWMTHPDRTHSRISSLKFYVEGVLNGPYYEYSNNGELELATYYRNGNYDGDYIEYKYGSPVVIAFYKQGLLHGSRTIYYTDRDIYTSIQKIENFQNGKLHGEVSWFNPDGKKTMEYIYKNGEMVSGGMIEE